MHHEAAILDLSPSDLAGHLACRHLTQLDRALAEGRLRVRLPVDPALEAMRERGRAHERAFVERLRVEGRSVVDLRGTADPAATREAMAAGHGAIVQAPLTAGRFRGRADVLLRIETGSALGPFSYEPVDTKLARDTRAGTILQLCTYAELLAALQAESPRQVHVVTPAAHETYRTADFAAYFRLVRDRALAAVDAMPPPETYPDPVPHCDVCRFWALCGKRRRDDDHLCLVAGIRTLHVRELQRQNLRTLAALAEADGELPEAPARGSTEVFRRLGQQARLQLAARAVPSPPWELLPVEALRGLCRLPEPSPGDVFLDLEGDPFVPGGGLEYLFGWAWRVGEERHYAARWVADPAAEKAALEACLDFVSERWRRFPDLHVYHFGAYEPSALKRLVGRYAVGAADLDRLLRGERLVDLHAVLREGVRAGVERYGLKELEAVTGFARCQALRDAARARQAVELALELRAPEVIEQADQATVLAYNEDDCWSAAALRDWLEARRAELLARGDPVPRPPAAEAEPSEKVSLRESAIRKVAEPLLAGLPGVGEPRTEDEHARWLLGQMLGYFLREEKCAWWEHYRLWELGEEELYEEREAVAGLELVRELPREGRQRCSMVRYRFPPQETALDPGDGVRAPASDDPEGGSFGEVIALDLAAGTIDLRHSARTTALRPRSVFRDQVVKGEVQEAALLALGQQVAERGPDGAGPSRAARDLLLRRPPRRREETGGPLRRGGEELLSAAVRLCRELDGGVLPIQGPPGSGKTYTGARAIVALAREGKRVGITAVSHKVIDNLLAEITRAAAEARVTLELVHKDDGGSVAGVLYVKDNQAAVDAVGRGAVVGGTAWLWARDDLAGSLDYLFVDEAGQMALAQALAAARAARNLVLLGDPQQLEQPRRGAHPEGTDVAALVHVLGAERATLADDQGLFLDRTWRLHPELCAFTSQVYYEHRERLLPVDGLERQELRGTAPFLGSGLFLVEAPHEGNQASAREEVEAVALVVRRLLQNGARWVDREKGELPLRPEGVLVVAPYNAQVAALRQRLRELGVERVGTVDKFQGQEAPVVIYSCTSSSPEDAPRGMAFLYDPHRFNVATSRARCAAIVVASPRLFEPDCRTPEQMRWANGLCRFRELATVVPIEKL